MFLHPKFSPILTGLTSLLLFMGQPHSSWAAPSTQDTLQVAPQAQEGLSAPSVQNEGYRIVTPINIFREGSTESLSIKFLTGSQLNQPPTLENLDDTVMQVPSSFCCSWFTTESAFPKNYFQAGLDPVVFEMQFLFTQEITDFICWGYKGNNNEATDFSLEFYDEQSRAYSEPVCVSTEHLLGIHSARLPLGGIHKSDRVRLTILNNAGGRGFNGIGTGDRVGMGELRFIAVQPYLIAPASIVQIQGDTLDQFDLGNVVNGEGLSEPPRLSNYTNVTHGEWGRWVTATSTFPSNYFRAGATPPVMEVGLDGLHLLSHLILWGYAGNNNEATDFELIFSVDPSQFIESSRVRVSSPHLVSNGNITLPLGHEILARQVRIVMLGNAGLRGLNGVGPGDRVGLGEIRWIGKPHPDPLPSSVNIQVTDGGFLVEHCNGVLETSTKLEGPWFSYRAAGRSKFIESVDERRYFRVR